MHYFDNFFEVQMAKESNAMESDFMQFESN